TTTTPTANMKYAFVAIALAAAVHAQTIDDVPECAIPCLDDAIASETDCATDDYPCVCENFDAIQGVATSCVISECGAETALNEVLPAVEALCENAGSEPTEEPSTSAAPTETATATETVVEPTEEPTETTVATTLTETKTKTDCHECEETTMMPTHAPTNGTGPAPTGEPSPVPTAGAAALVPGLALAGLAALAL
ncbi:TPA: CFEM domain-containing protein, partial [Escherichia coli]|nr:CFEM domain-containing protein [Escherichia coli]